MYQNIEKKLHKELEKMDKKFENEGTEMSNQDLELIDCIYHALKSGATYEAMMEGGMSGGYSGGNYGGSGNYSGNSYARGRDSRGRYTSRDMSREGGGYSGGYSGHYPPMGYYPESFEGGRW